MMPPAGPGSSYMTYAIEVRFQYDSALLFIQSRFCGDASVCKTPPVSLVPAKRQNKSGG